MKQAVSASMLQSYRESCRTRRASLVAGMALALAGRSVGFVPAGTRTASVRTRPMSKVAMRTPLFGHSRASSVSSTYRLNQRTWHTLDMQILAGRVAANPCCVTSRGVYAGPVAMCSAQATATDGSSVEVTAEAAALEAQIKLKGDFIRDLKASGTEKGNLKPHIEVIHL